MIPSFVWASPLLFLSALEPCRYIITSPTCLRSVTQPKDDRPLMILFVGEYPGPRARRTGTIQDPANGRSMNHGPSARAPRQNTSF
ncbi:hypothetical protein F5B18DRAFT_34617 [Nemania serpens]|nr:hypothetical protein F5B18DRAFT_34617 [Nemania serpens]